MKDEEYLSPALQAILDEFTRFRDEYLALKAFCDAQEKTLTMENEQLDRTKNNLDKLLQAYLFLENRYKSTVEGLQTENGNLRKTIEDLKEQCDRLRFIATDYNGNNEQTIKLQDEIEVLKAQLLMQEEKHGENVALLKQQHSDEIQRYKVLLLNAKQDVTSCQNKRGRRPKNSNKSKKITPCFRWPQLDIEKTNVTPMDIEEEIKNRVAGNKKRKLFHENDDAAINIV